MWNLLESIEYINSIKKREWERIIPETSVLIQFTKKCCFNCLFWDKLKWFDIWYVLCKDNDMEFPWRHYCKNYDED